MLCACMCRKEAVEARVRSEATNKRKCLILDDLCLPAVATKSANPEDGCDAIEEVKKRKKAQSFSDGGSEVTELGSSSDDEYANDGPAGSSQYTTTAKAANKEAPVYAKAGKNSRFINLQRGARLQTRARILIPDTVPAAKSRAKKADAQQVLLSTSISSYICT